MLWRLKEKRFDFNGEIQEQKIQEDRKINLERLVCVKIVWYKRHLLKQHRHLLIYFLNSSMVNMQTKNTTNTPYTLSHQDDCDKNLFVSVSEKDWRMVQNLPLYLILFKIIYKNVNFCFVSARPWRISHTIQR